jgi:hypothetical protein
VVKVATVLLAMLAIARDSTWTGQTSHLSATVDGLPPYREMMKNPLVARGSVVQAVSAAASR